MQATGFATGGRLVPESIMLKSLPGLEFDQKELLPARVELFCSLAMSTRKSGAAKADASVDAKSVFPTPGGPTSRIGGMRCAAFFSHSLTCGTTTESSTSEKLGNASRMRSTADIVAASAPRSGRYRPPSISRFWTARKRFLSSSEAPDCSASATVKTRTGRSPAAAILTTCELDFRLIFFIAVFRSRASRELSPACRAARSSRSCSSGSTSSFSMKSSGEQFGDVEFHGVLSLFCGA